jgi:hypothetical protein
MQILQKGCTRKGELSTYHCSKECYYSERLLLFEKRGGLSVFRAGGWRKGLMGDIQGLAQWPEIKPEAGG